MKKINAIFKIYHGLPKEIYVVAISRFINSTGLFIFPMLTLLLTKKIGLSEAETGFWIALSGIISIPVSIIGGKLTDIIGRKKLIIYPNIIATILFTFCGFIEPSMLMVYLIFSGGTILHSSRPAFDSLIADLTTPKNRNASFSLSYLGNNLGFAIGPFIGGLLFNNHLRLFFLLDAFTTLLSTIIITIFIKETLFKTEEIIEEGLEKSVKGSAIKVLLKRPVLLIFAILSLGYHFTYSQWSFLMPMHLESLFTNEGAKLFGMLASFNGIIVIIFTPIITSLFSKLNNLRNAVIGGLLYTIGFGLLGFFETKSSFVLSAFIFTLGEIILVISVMPFIANHTPASHRGRINSLLSVIMGAGYFLGPIIVGNLLKTISYTSAWKFVSIIVLISSIGMYILQIFEKTMLHNQKE
ncbi:MAG: MFS transporter [Bacillota bacterium]|nr:MFS transporter [Bacillota bacterium]